MHRQHLEDADVSADAEEDTVPSYWPEENQALVRMYGQGLGDCFLLAFPRTRPTDVVPMSNDARPVYVLIDCGVIAGTPDVTDRMRRIVRDIRLTTRDENLKDENGKPKGHLDLLVITNSHWDHISGFIDAAEEWKGIQVDALWTAWTERVDADEVAGVLRRVTDKQRKALAQVADSANQGKLDDRLGLATRLASFLTATPLADDECDETLHTTPDISAIARDRVNNDCWITCEPGDVRRVPGTRASAYVLGPPRDWDRLQPIDPIPRPVRAGDGQSAPGQSSRRERSHAVSDPAAPIRRYVDEPSSLNAVVVPLLGAPAVSVNEDDTRQSENAEQDRASQLADRDVYLRTFPFDRALRVPLSIAETAATCYPDEYQALASYFDGASHWRRIDNDWLVGVESFTLQVDNLINNTSLVLALELPPVAAGSEAKVLLFVSDAQIGNWMSWDEIAAWQPRDGATPSQKQPNIADLLQRTVWYKVGHHGSANATPRDLGIDRMRKDGALIAFVPAFAPPSEDVAQKLERWPNLPHREVMDALSVRTGSQVVFADGTIWGYSKELKQARRRVGIEVSQTMLQREERDEAGNVNIVENPLWVQMAIDY